MINAKIIERKSLFSLNELCSLRINSRYIPLVDSSERFRRMGLLNVSLEISSRPLKDSRILKCVGEDATGGFHLYELSRGTRFEFCKTKIKSLFGKTPERIYFRIKQKK